MPRLRPAVLLALLSCTWAATTARADGRVLLMAQEAERGALVEALREELAPRAIEVTPAGPPSGSTRLQRAAAAQRAASQSHAHAALWIEEVGEEASLHVVSAMGELPEKARLPRPLGELPPRVFAVIASALLAEIEQVPPPPGAPPAGTPAQGPSAAPPAQPGSGSAEPTPPTNLGEPAPGSTRPPPGAEPLPGAGPPGAPPTPLPPGVHPAPPPPGQSPHPPAGPYPYGTQPGYTPTYPYGPHGAPQAYGPERPPGFDARRTERERQRAERRKRRGPRMPRDEWHWRIGGVATATPRVDEFGWQPYQPQDGYALRVTFGRLVATRLRLDLVGAIGAVPGYGPFGNLGGQVQFVTAAWAFRFATGLSATAMIAADRFEDDEFGWVGVELFFPLELGWELNEDFGIDFAVGLTMTKPGDEDFWPGGMFVLELEIAQ